MAKGFKNFLKQEVSSEKEIEKERKPFGNLLCLHIGNDDLGFFRVENVPTLSLLIKIKEEFPFEFLTQDYIDEFLSERRDITSNNIIKALKKLKSTPPITYKNVRELEKYNLDHFAMLKHLYKLIEQHTVKLS